MKSKQSDIVIHVRFSREQVKAMHSRAKKETGGNVSELVRRKMFPEQEEAVSGIIISNAVAEVVSA